MTNHPACIAAVNELRDSNDNALSLLGTVAHNRISDGHYESALDYLLGAQDALQASGEYGTDRIAVIKQCRLQLKAAIPGRLHR